MIALTEITKTFDEGRTTAVDALDLEIKAGRLVVLLGESGCGKTTTLKMINRLIEPTRGSIEVDGERIENHDPVELRRHIGFVIQNVGLFPHMTVGENIGVVPKLLNWSKQQISDRVDELLEMVNMGGDSFRERMPDQLSGGQRQRIGVARALAARPKIMLMDEPFGALDPLTRDELQREYRKIHDELELTSVMVTHDMTEALIMADQIAVMNAGRIVQLGTPHELLTDPADDYVEKMMATPRKQADMVDRLLEAETEATGETAGSER